ncbi:hypothetical protein A464_2160 [Salmonella bongori N268-08]|uniref:Uncharacterized protein n=1 Tax=Salmonella bongori N268-08 TaxID=1197719 RepID=S5N9R9_SALBN|nr:hypothetical protein A464_2160 [Salmonella bongori N268-08]
MPNSKYLSREQETKFIISITQLLLIKNRPINNGPTDDEK